MNYLGIALNVKTRGEIQDNPHGLIDRTLQGMNEAYKAGALEWMKGSRPEDWKRMVAMETMINEKALTGDIEGLRKALEEYPGFMLEMVKAFSSGGEEVTLFSTQKGGKANGERDNRNLRLRLQEVPSFFG